MKQPEYIELLTFRWILFRNFQNHVNSFKKEVPIRTLLCRKCPNTEFFLVRIFLYSDWMRRENLRIQAEYWKIRIRKTPYLDIFHAVPPSWNSSYHFTLLFSFIFLLQSKQHGNKHLHMVHRFIGHIFPPPLASRAVPKNWINDEMHVKTNHTKTYFESTKNQKKCIVFERFFRWLCLFFEIQFSINSKIRMQDMIAAGIYEYLFCNFLWDLRKLKIRKTFVLNLVF